MPDYHQRRRVAPWLWVLVFVVVGLLTTSVSFAKDVAPVEVQPDTAKLSSGDTAWMLTSSALVLMMTGPGLALFYGGLVRRKNVLATMMQSFILMAAVSIVWAVVGYSLAFDVGTPFIGGLRFALLRGVGAAPSEYAPTIPHTTWMIYQAMFAIITPALICGAYAERMKFSSMLTFSVLWLLCIYCPMAHMVWGKGGLFNAWMGGRFAAIDFAGGTVVHVSSGVSALVCAIVLGKRRGYGHTPMPPHSVVLSVIGAAMLWVGWFGFNAGSALAANGLASAAFVNTHFAAAAAALAWAFYEWIKNGKATVLGAISGAVAGLVVITPAAGYTTPMYAILMGVIGGIVCALASTWLKHKFGYDDSLDAFGVHGTGGTLGSLLTGVFAVAAVNLPTAYAAPPGATAKLGLLEGNGAIMVNQFAATAMTWVIAALGSLVLLKVVDALVGLRVAVDDEVLGLDLSQHGEAGYVLEDAESGSLVQGHGDGGEYVPEPRAADVPPNGKRRFTVVLEGAPETQLIHAWSDLCNVRPDGPSTEFRNVYPHVTTVKGNRFRFRDGEPNSMKENLVKLFQRATGNASLTARVEA